MKYLSILLFSFFLFNSTTNIDFNSTENSFVVIQLFTSQGCSSCPPADILVGKIKEEYKDLNVYVMSYHVDYWDRLGWKDPFGKRKFTEIQYRYADQFKERQVYTPQIVVNGREHFIGSNGTKLRRRIKAYLKKESRNTITISSDKNSEGNIVFNYNVSGDVKGKKLKLAFVLENHVTQVKKGENSNRTLTNSNIVLEEFVLELKNQNKGSFILPKENFDTKKDLKLIGFVQNDRLEITGACQLDF
ncbi:MAG: DUF1223 domain-containing protein [Flavobacteriaceae bacterium]|nr:DUF1223 domain-containing protein [Flavobacteriaceae bacterium]